MSINFFKPNSSVNSDFNLSFGDVVSARVGSEIDSQLIFKFMVIGEIDGNVLVINIEKLKSIASNKKNILSFCDNDCSNSSIGYEIILKSSISSIEKNEGLQDYVYSKIRMDILLDKEYAKYLKNGIECGDIVENDGIRFLVIEKGEKLTLLKINYFNNKKIKIDYEFTMDCSINDVVYVGTVNSSIFDKINKSYNSYINMKNSNKSISININRGYILYFDETFYLVTNVTGNSIELVKVSFDSLSSDSIGISDNLSIMLHTNSRRLINTSYFLNHTSYKVIFEIGSPAFDIIIDQMKKWNNSSSCSKPATIKKGKSAPRLDNNKVNFPNNVYLNYAFFDSLFYVYEINKEEHKIMAISVNDYFFNNSVIVYQFNTDDDNFSLVKTNNTTALDKLRKVAITIKTGQINPAAIRDYSNSVWENQCDPQKRKARSRAKRKCKELKLIL